VAAPGIVRLKKEKKGMTAFNPRHLARQVPATTWQAYLSSRSIAIPESFG